MLKCSYCGRENTDNSSVCEECGTALAGEPWTEVPLRLPHHMMGDIQKWIWGYWGVKRRRFYLAGLFIGMLGPAVALPASGRGFVLWAVAAGGALGVVAVWVLSFVETLQTRLNKAREGGKPVLGRQILFVFAALATLALAVLLAVGIAFLCFHISHQ